MKQFLITLILAPIVVPALAARDPMPLRGLRRGLWLVLAFNLVYALVVGLFFPSNPEEIMP
jgi:hypothetical protein